MTEPRFTRRLEVTVRWGNLKHKLTSAEFCEPDHADKSYKEFFVALFNNKRKELADNLGIPYDYLVWFAEIEYCTFFDPNDIRMYYRYIQQERQPLVYETNTQKETSPFSSSTTSTC